MVTKYRLGKNGLNEYVVQSFLALDYSIGADFVDEIYTTVATFDSEEKGLDKLKELEAEMILNKKRQTIDVIKVIGD